MGLQLQFGIQILDGELWWADTGFKMPPRKVPVPSGRWLGIVMCCVPSS